MGSTPLSETTLRESDSILSKKVKSLYLFSRHFCFWCLKIDERKNFFGSWKTEKSSSWNRVISTQLFYFFTFCKVACLFLSENSDTDITEMMCNTQSWLEELFWSWFSPRFVDFNSLRGIEPTLANFTGFKLWQKLSTITSNFSIF